MIANLRPIPPGLAAGKMFHDDKPGKSQVEALFRFFGNNRDSRSIPSRHSFPYTSVLPTHWGSIGF